MPVPVRGAAGAERGQVTAHQVDTVTVDVAGDQFTLPYMTDAPPPVGATVWVGWFGRTGIVMYAAAGTASQTCVSLVPSGTGDTLIAGGGVRFGPGDLSKDVTVTIVTAAPINQSSLIIDLEQQDGDTRSATATGGPWTTGASITVTMPGGSGGSAWDWLKAEYLPLASGTVCWET